MNETLSYILKAILGTDVKIEEEEESGFITFTARIPKDQVGIVIGKNGKTIHAIKTLLKIKAIKEDKRIDVRVLEA